MRRLEILVQRPEARGSNSYGKNPEDLRRFHEDVATVEPLLRRVATHEIRTTAPLGEVVATLLRIVDV